MALLPATTLVTRLERVEQVIKQFVSGTSDHHPFKDLLLKGEERFQWPHFSSKLSFWKEKEDMYDHIINPTLMVMMQNLKNYVHI